MLTFRDFVPHQVKRAGFVEESDYESFEAAVHAAREFLEETPKAHLVQVETVVLPNIHRTYEDGSGDTSLEVADDDQTTTWHQFVRLWYRIAA
jgi:hypothetical protein